jgi:hypothetical protein
MQVSGRVTRVAGLVMEAVGLRLAVGAACTVPLPSGGRVEAEVVGFEGERLFLMPQSDVEGIVPGTRVFPVEQPIPKPRRRDPSAPPQQRPRAPAAGGPRAAGPRGRRRRPSARRLGSDPDQRQRPHQCAPRQPAGPRAHRGNAGRGRALHQCDADRRPWPAHGPVRRFRRRQVRAAGHDGALHGRRRHRGRPDRRTGPRGQGIHRADFGRGRPGAARWWWPRRPTRRR